MSSEAFCFVEKSPAFQQIRENVLVAVHFSVKSPSRLIRSRGQTALLDNTGTGRGGENGDNLKARI
jgi:hypothetical protein